MKKQMTGPGWVEGAFPKFSKAEYHRRFQLIRKLMLQEDVEALVIHGTTAMGSAVHYLSHYVPARPTWLIFPLEGPSTLFLHFYNHILCTKALSIVEDIRCYHPNPGNAVANNLKERGLGASRVGVVGLGSTIPHAQFETLKDECPEVEFKDLAHPFNQIRLIRSEEELEWFRESGRLTDLTCEALEREIRPGLTEYDLSTIIHRAFLPESGHMGIHFLSTTSMQNPEQPVPWQYLTPREIERGDVVITEITISYWGYATQIHRPFTVSTKPTSIYQELFDRATECFEAVRGIAKPGTTSEEIVDISTQMTEDKGYPILDSLFHGEGGRNPELGTHNSHHIFEQYELKENMVVVVQPNLTANNGKAGLQVGAAMIVKSTGGELLNRYPFHFPICG